MGQVVVADRPIRGAVLWLVVWWMFVFGHDASLADKLLGATFVAPLGASIAYALIWRFLFAMLAELPVLGGLYR